MADVDPRKAERRTLHFGSLDQMLAEVDCIVAAERAGSLRRTGNWTTGQTFGHIAAWIEYAYVGYPPEMRVPWIVRVVARLMKRGILRRPMRGGFRLPGAAKGTFGTEEMSTDEGARRLRDATARLKRREPAAHHSPALGPLTDEERTQLNLRHAELHLGYLIPGE